MSEKAVEKVVYKTALIKINDIYYPMIERQLIGNGIVMDDYQKKCVLNAIGAINNVLATAGVAWCDKQLDQSNITQILLHVASLKLNASASPREVYFQLRNVKVKTKDENGREVDVWRKQIEMGIEGDGNDAILANFGRDIKEIRQFWMVRENDEFQYPEYNGLEMTPPHWKPKGSGKVVRVVYPVIKKSGAVEFYISEREDVIKNLIAHINNNLMNETFGIAKNRYEATPQQLEKIAAKKKEIIDKTKSLGLDAALDDPELQKYISPAWREPHSREAMIVRKMRNNIVKKIPKDFGSTLAALNYEEVTDENPIKKEIAEHANSEVIDIDLDDYSVIVETPEPPKSEPEVQKENEQPKTQEKKDEVKPQKEPKPTQQQLDFEDEVPY